MLGDSNESRSLHHLLCLSPFSAGGSELPSCRPAAGTGMLQPRPPAGAAAGSPQVLSLRKLQHRPSSPATRRLAAGGRQRSSAGRRLPQQLASAGRSWLLRDWSAAIGDRRSVTCSGQLRRCSNWPGTAWALAVTGRGLWRPDMQNMQKTS